LQPVGPLPFPENPRNVRLPDFKIVGLKPAEAISWCFVNDQARLAHGARYERGSFPQPKFRVRDPRPQFQKPGVKPRTP
jgi:hypothetical protein